MGNGYISTRRNVNGYNGTSGPLRIGQATNRAGSIIQAAYIEVNAGPGGGNGAQGLYIHGSGDVLIQNSAGVAGNLVGSDPVNLSSMGVKNGPIQVLHQGSFRAATVRLRNVSGDGGTARDVLFDGAVVDPGVRNGAFAVSNIWTWTYNWSVNHWTMNAAPVIIRNY